MKAYQVLDKEFRLPAGSGLDGLCIFETLDDAINFLEWFAEDSGIEQEDYIIIPVNVEVIK